MARNEWRCGRGGGRKANGNCEIPDGDGLAIQGVGPWTLDKHDWLRRFIEATWAARDRYVPPSPGKAGSAYVDIFAGPGRIRVERESDGHDGSPLIALAHDKSPFSSVILCDKEPENIEALAARTSRYGRRVEIVSGNCNEEIDRITAVIPRLGLNLAFIDPFGPSALEWATLTRLGSFPRMDMVINVPTGAIKRNLDRDTFHAHIDAMLGSREWRGKVKDASDASKLIELLRERLSTLGYRSEYSQSVRFTNSKNVPMFYLTFFSKHKLADRIWKSVARTTPSGQRSLGFD